MSDQIGSGDRSATLDALPSAPIPSAQPSDHQDHPHDGRSSQDQRSPTARFSIPAPPADWQFNVFLDQLSERLTENELKRIKLFFEGDRGIGKGALEKIGSAVDLFRILKQRCFISRDNLLYLQAALYCVGRKDLVKEAIEHAKTIGDCLHFYSPSFQPENGYKYVKFHVAGKDFQTFCRKDLYDIRRIMSILLMVPEQFVIIAGIEPASSIVVTFMIPELYVEILAELFISNEDFTCLLDVGVDVVEIDADKQYRTKGTNESAHEKGEQQIQLANVYQQLQEAKCQLDDTESKFLDVFHQLDNLQSRYNELEVSLNKAECQIETITKILCLTKDESSPATLKEITSVHQFSMALNQLSLVNVDRKLMTTLIDSIIRIVTNRLKEGYRIQTEQLLLSLQDMQSQLVPFMFELERYKFIANLGNLDKGFLESLQHLLNTLTVAPTLQLTLTPQGLETTKKISNKLRNKEKEKLKKKYTWVKDGQIEKFMDQDPSLFLAGIFYKELEKTQRVVHFETFLSQCLTEVDREDLKKHLEPKPSAANVRNQQQQQRQHQQNFQQHQQQFNRPAPEAAGAQKCTDERLESVITNMAKQIQEMYDMIISKQASFASKFDEWKTPSYPFSSNPFQPKEKL